MHAKKFIIIGIISCLLLLPHCLEQVKFIPETESNATLIIIRDGGNEDDEIGIFVDSLLVGYTYKDAISIVTVPTGNHYIFFEWEGEFEGFNLDFVAEKAYAINQFVLNAYVYKQFNNSALNDSAFFVKVGNPQLEKYQFSYRDAKEQMSTGDFYENVKSLENKFEFRGSGFKIRIEE